VTVGLLTATAGGILYLLSLLFVDKPRVSVAILLLGRALLDKSGDRLDGSSHAEPGPGPPRHARLSSARGQEFERQTVELAVECEWRLVV
jgi:hypothetical protein